MSNSKKPLVSATYDPVAKAGYIYLDGTIGPGEVKETRMVMDDVYFDFDHMGRIIGIELLNPRKHMPKGLAATCKIYGVKGDYSDE